jgi:DNA-binding response OmpR family regulator
MEPERQAPTILLVDDDPIVHWVLAQYLGRAGYQIVSTYNGREALESVRRRAPQLILLDVRMDELDGLATLKQLKEAEATKAVPVIMMTVNDDWLTKLKSETFGAEVFLSKPFSPTELVAQIERLIGSAHAPGSPLTR